MSCLTRVSIVISILALGVFTAKAAFAREAGSVFLDPHIVVGSNGAQGTFFLGGLDLGYAISDQLVAGVHGYYSAGGHPSDDREIGGGAFAGFTQPFTSFLLGQVRQELNYVDLYDPIVVNGDVVGHDREFGTVSVTSAGVHLFFTPNFGLAAGYRLVVALANHDLDDGRSGMFVGFSIGI